MRAAAFMAQAQRQPRPGPRLVPPRPAAVRALGATLAASEAMGPSFVSACNRSATWPASLCMEVTGVKRPSSSCPCQRPLSIHSFIHSAPSTSLIMFQVLRTQSDT